MGGVNEMSKEETLRIGMVGYGFMGRAAFQRLHPGAAVLRPAAA